VALEALDCSNGEKNTQRLRFDYRYIGFFIVDTVDLRIALNDKSGLVSRWYLILEVIDLTSFDDIRIRRP